MLKTSIFFLWAERKVVQLFHKYELLRTGNDLCVLEEWLLTVHRLLRVKILDMKNWSGRAERLCLVMPMTLWRNLKPGGALWTVSVIFCPFFFFLSECQSGISTIHQLLNVSTRQGPLYSSATSGKVTRQSSVCHKLSEIIDACCCGVPLSLSNDLFQSFTFNNTAELKEAVYLRLPSLLSSRRSKGSRYGIKYFCQKRFWFGFLAAIIWSAWIKHEDDMGNTACSPWDSGDCPPRRRGARLTVAFTVTLAFTKSALWDLRHAAAGSQGFYLKWRHNFH